MLVHPSLCAPVSLGFPHPISRQHFSDVHDYHSPLSSIDYHLAAPVFGLPPFPRWPQLASRLHLAKGSTAPDSLTGFPLHSITIRTSAWTTPRTSPERVRSSPVCFPYFHSVPFPSLQSIPSASPTRFQQSASGQHRNSGTHHRHTGVSLSSIVSFRTAPELLA